VGLQAFSEEVRRKKKRAGKVKRGQQKKRERRIKDLTPNLTDVDRGKERTSEGQKESRDWPPHNTGLTKLGFPVSCGKEAGGPSQHRTVWSGRETHNQGPKKVRLGV